jgi:formylmethanofuran dehydrogenase subunit E
MLLNMAFKRVVDFHGHLCPDLVLGAKFCEYVKKILLTSGELTGGISIVAENCTSALDAIQNKSKS